jgi:2-keto-3-deoxy-L-rhamnonate aldolase RhmA
MDIDATAAFRQKLRGRQLLFGGWTSIGHPQITEVFATSGVDFIGIDIEHSTISLEQSLAIIAASQAARTICLPRIASHNPEMIKRLLDSGADGVIVPMVATPAEVENIIAWTKYPPDGRRSFGVARAQTYGHDFQNYAKRWNEASSIIIQIETVEGVENIEKLLAYDEIDGAMVGPYDLSGSLGIPGQIDSPKVQEAAKHVNEVCRKLGRACGTHLVEPTTAGMAKAVADGFTFALLASDVFLLAQWARMIKKQIADTRGAGR